MNIFQHHVVVSYAFDIGTPDNCPHVVIKVEILCKCCFDLVKIQQCNIKVSLAQWVPVELLHEVCISFLSWRSIFVATVCLRMYLDQGFGEGKGNGNGNGNGKVR